MSDTTLQNESTLQLQEAIFSICALRCRAHVRPAPRALFVPTNGGPVVLAEAKIKERSAGPHRSMVGPSPPRKMMEYPEKKEAPNRQRPRSTAVSPELSCCGPGSIRKKGGNVLAIRARPPTEGRPDQYESNPQPQSTKS